MGFFRYPLLRYRVLPVTIALFAALWLALPALKALAVSPDIGPIHGNATAKAPPGGCSGQSDTVQYPVTVSVTGDPNIDGFMDIIDPAGGASGPITPDGTGHLTGAQETYDLQSIQGDTLILSELYAGCQFQTTIVLDRVLFQVPTVPPATQVSETSVEPTVSTPVDETAVQPTVSSTPAGVSVPSSGGRSLTWLWVTGAVAGVGALGGGLFLVLRQPGASTDVEDDCSKEWDRVRRAFEEARPYLDADDADDDLVELAIALFELAKCRGEPEVSYDDPDVRRSTLIRLGLLPKPDPGFDPVPPAPDPGVDPLPPPEGDGNERKEIG